MKEKLTKLEAFDAMAKFLEGYYERTKSNDFGSLLSDMLYSSEGCTSDPAAWTNWSNSVNTVLNETSKAYQNNMHEKLTKLQAFSAMRKFLEIYYEQTTHSDDVGTLLSGMNFLSDGGTVDPAAWENWTKCVNDIQKKNNESTAA
ncbi:MAG: hypothetical protein P4L31_06115 [Candidatus Babeliales bacterium]|nr:hypothetical protein [Candidatus Babeliales bacterium]